MGTRTKIRITATGIIAAVSLSLLTACSWGPESAAAGVQRALFGLPGVKFASATVNGNGVTSDFGWDARVTMEPNAEDDQYVEVVRVWNEHSAGGRSENETTLMVEAIGEYDRVPRFEIGTGVDDRTAVFEAERWRALVDDFERVHVVLEHDWRADEPGFRRTVRVDGSYSPEQQAALVAAFNDEYERQPAHAASETSIELRPGGILPGGATWVDLPMPNEQIEQVAAFQAPFDRARPLGGSVFKFEWLTPTQPYDGEAPEPQELAVAIRLTDLSPDELAPGEWESRFRETARWSIMLDFADAVPADAVGLSVVIGAARINASDCAPDPDDPVSAGLWTDWRKRVGMPPDGRCDTP
ncbi:hypothetical protein JOE59_003657 [Agromyces cerinus]|uniref:hypothetical protein n=1 Tax=Agromyces cerinus TaxID=33878 RepID=UPI00195EBBCB|nr:hypothetical protein [Agromyces cerinus]MBM7832952.1 hypothetical protein [Agromyces cerinus]